MRHRQRVWCRRRGTVSCGLKLDEHDWREADVADRVRGVGDVIDLEGDQCLGTDPALWISGGALGRLKEELNAMVMAVSIEEE